jgi:hypothetical protein
LSTQTTQLDLSQVGSEDLENLARKIEDFYKSDTTAKSALSYNWERNHLMLDGKQWIVYDGERGQGGQWRQLQVQRANEYIPRPVTNYLFDIYQTLKSYLIQHRPRSTVTPNTQLRKDKMAAKLATIVLEANWERLKETQNYEYAASVCVLYGTVFKKSYWDTSSLQVARVPRMELVDVTDPMTGMVTGQQEQPVIDPMTGEEIIDELPLGDVNTTVVEPYRFILDPLATDLHTARWVMEYSIQPIERVQELYDKQEEGYTGLAAMLTPEKALSSSLSRFYNLKTSSGVRSGSSITAQGKGEMVENAVVLKEYYEAPTRKFPKGRLVVVANGLTLYSGASPCEGPELGDWHPYSECRWELVPGRFWGKSPLDDTTEIQKQVNSIDAAIILTRKTMAIPQKLIPTDSGIKPGEWTGRPGQEIRYRSTGATPSTIPAAGVDPQVFQERKQKLEDMKAISGAVDILKGDRPPGVTAASALEMLFEVGTGKLRPSLERWKCFIENDQKKQLRLTARMYREPRDQFIRLLHQKNKGLPKETIDNFIGSDLYDNCNVVIEAGSNIPKLQSAEKANLREMAMLGTLNLESPQNKMEFNRRMGVIGFDNEVGPDVERAEWENDLMDDILQSPDNKPVVLADELHDVHREIHLRRMKEPAFITLPAEVQEAYMEHLAEHDMHIEAKKTMELEEAMATGRPPQPQGAPDKIATKAHGKGNPPDVQAQLAMPDAPKRTA